MTELARETGRRETEPDRWVGRLRGQATRDEAISELTRILVRGLSKPLLERYGSKVDPEDIAQEAILKILNSLDDFRGESKFTSWAMTIAIRMGISELRRKYHQDVSLESVTEGGLQINVSTRHDSIERKLDRAVIEELLSKLIETRLSDRQKIAVRALLEGMPMEIIAEKLDSNRNAVYKLFHDARMKLKEGFEQAGMNAQDISAAITPAN